MISNSHIVHIIHIAKTSMYDSLSSASDALDLMKSTYAGSTWHYTDDSGNNPDLHHGIFYKSMGGGKYFILAFSQTNIIRNQNWLT